LRQPFDLLAETTAFAAQVARDGRRNLTKSEIWLLVPKPDFRRILEDVRQFRIAA
jgi:hypothetical protein